MSSVYADTIFKISDMDFFLRMSGKFIRSFFEESHLRDCVITPFGVVCATMSTHRGKADYYSASFTSWDDISYLRLQNSILWMRKVGGAVDEKIGSLKAKAIKELIASFTYPS